jgi:hypothetical protein
MLGLAECGSVSTGNSLIWKELKYTSELLWYSSFSMMLSIALDKYQIFGVLSFVCL